MTGQLYPLLAASDAWSGDPVRPAVGEVTPDEVVAHLSEDEQRLRLSHLVAQAHQILADAVATHAEGRQIVAVVGLFSGGGDSTALVHLLRDQLTHAAHANTGIGIESTRQHVRDLCQLWGLPLLEKHPPVSYRDLVLERGFPGPAMHFKMYTRLKERCLDQVRRDLVRNPRRERVVFVAGRRRSESARRAQVPIHERRGSVIWASPLVSWTALDLSRYRATHALPSCPASSLIHMSGECLCGAFARRGELDEIGDWFPEVRAEIEALEREVRAAGHPEPFCRWGHGQGAAVARRSDRVGALCTSCTLWDDDAADVEGGAS